MKTIPTLLFFINSYLEIKFGLVISGYSILSRLFGALSQGQKLSCVIIFVQYTFKGLANDLHDVFQ